MGSVLTRLGRTATVAVLVLAFGAVDAHAVTYDFTVNPATPNQGEPATLRLTPTSAEVERVRWDLDDDGEFDDGTTRTVTRTYADPGPVTVRMRAREQKGSPFQTVTKTIRVNGRPTADFGFSPAEPVAGERVSFSSAATDPDGDAITLEWVFGDGGTAAGAAPAHAYAEARTYDVSLTATDEHGATFTRTHQVTVRQDPPAPPADTPPGTPTPPVGEPAPTGSGGFLTPIEPHLMRPFPVVRIAGVILPHGSRVRILSVRAPLGAHISVRCFGRGCPAGAPARTNRRSLVRFHRFERFLRAGVRLKVFVRQANRIGKYTRFLIRAGKPPGRRDRCLMPGRARPVRCP